MRRTGNLRAFADRTYRESSGRQTHNSHSCWKYQASNHGTARLQGCVQDAMQGLKVLHKAQDYEEVSCKQTFAAK